MNPLTLNIGQRYMYSTNHGAIEISYLGPFQGMPGGGWYDFRIKNDYKDEIITISGASIDRGDLIASEILA